jgi:alpha-galactosidase
VIEHDYTEEVTEPTCTDEGYTTYTCDSCGYTYVGNYTDVIEHNYTVEVKESTCIEMGYRIYTCVDCGDSYSEDIEYAEHDYFEIDRTDTEVTYTCAGVNHQAFYLDLKWNGQDMYPLLREAMKKPEIYNNEQVRNDMFMHLDYYVTESSGHNSEYVAWYRKRADLIDKYCTTGTGWNPGEHSYILNYYLDRKDTWRDSINEWLDKPDEEVELERGEEYAAYIFNAVFGDNTIFKFNGNVRNYGLIENLPEGCCVEIPVVASRDSLESVSVGKIPEHLAVLINTTARCEELAVQAALEGDAKKVFWACAFDPLTSAVLTLDEIRQMVNEMLEQNKDYLPWYQG